MTIRPAGKTITLTYGLFALVLLATLIIGLLSGGVLGGLTFSAASRRSGEPVDPPAAVDRAWIGITYMPVTQAVAASHNLAVTKGALIVAITPNGPAARSGLREDDVITAVDGRPIDETSSLMELIEGKKPGDTVKIAFVRDGSSQTNDLVVGRLPTRSDGNDASIFHRLGRSVGRFIWGR